MARIVVSVVSSDCRCGTFLLLYPPVYIGHKYAQLQAAYATLQDNSVYEFPMISYELVASYENLIVVVTCE